MQSIDGLLENGALHILIFLSVIDSSRTLPRFYTDSSETVGICGLATSKNTSLRTRPLTRARLLDFADLKAIRHNPNRPSNLSRVFWTSFFLFRVMSSTNAFIGGMCKPLPMYAYGILDPAVFGRICIGSTNREGEIVHPITIPTSRGTHLVVYVLVENRIMNPLKYSWRMWITG